MEDLVKFPSESFWRGRRVLVTGHTGFKGSWLAFWLTRMGAKVSGLALPPDYPNAIHGSMRLASESFVDIRDREATREAMRRADPEFVFHLAAQALVRQGYQDPLTTFASNVTGTAHVLEASRHLNSLAAIVVITSDKVYLNDGTGRAFVESDPLGGSDPYSASKVGTEMVVAGYRAAVFEASGIGLATARAGNVIGGGDWSCDRLIPDAVRSWSTGTCLKIRHPFSTRPWQHVLEPLRGYLLLAERLAGGQVRHPAFNFGPRERETATVRDVIALAGEHFPGGLTLFADDADGPREARLLALDSGLAERELGAGALWSLRETVSRTASWYRAFLEGGDVRGLCDGDLEAYAGGVRDAERLAS